MERATAQAGVDRAYEFVMRDLFLSAMRHIERSDIDGARAILSKGFTNAQRVHDELMAIIPK